MPKNEKIIEPLLFELSEAGRIAVELPACDVPAQLVGDLLPAGSLRAEVNLPELSEPEVIRHYTHLSRENYCVDLGFYPLGSCTMKYNPKINEEAARLSGFGRLHPYLPDTAAQGTLEVLFEMQHILTQIAGMDACSLQPAAGAHGELLGLMLIKAYHEDKGEGHRDTILVPEAAHGTNPASAARCGYKAVTVKSDSRGRVDVAHLKTLLGGHVAGLMLTNPNTLGLFEDDITEICDLIHTSGGLIYCDGANMNALVGRARPGDMGFDVMHFNLHKTFSSPHGGGGPGSGPVAVKKILEPFLPVPQVIKEEGDNGAYRLDFGRAKSIGKIHGYFGSFLCILRSYIYILYYGRERLAQIAENAVLNANYIRVRLEKHFDVAYNEICMHECVFTARRQQKANGVRALDIAKRLMDFGYHPPTIYFPLLVPEAMMIEPTETESRQTLDDFIDAMQQIARDADDDPEIVKSAPHNTIVRKLDEATAARQPILSWTPPAVPQEPMATDNALAVAHK